MCAMRCSGSSLLGKDDAKKKPAGKNETLAMGTEAMQLAEPAPQSRQRCGQW